MQSSNTSVSEEINKVIDNLIQLNRSKAPSQEIIQKLEVLKNECDKGLENRVEVGKCGAYTVILDILLNYQNNNDVRKNCLRALIALMVKQPDLLDPRGVEVILSLLKKEVDFDLKKLALKWTRECCILHEINRQKIFNAHILDNLKELLNEGTTEILREVLAVLRALVLDDDVRVEYGRAHEHARIIASETLCALVGLLTRFRTDEQLINDLMLTLSSLVVRNEFCKKVEDAGGLELIKDTLQLFQFSDRINRQCFKLLKALAGNDSCKAHIVSKGLAPIIANAVEANMTTVQTATAGLACIAALCLRSPDNSIVFFEIDTPKVIVETMKMHSEEKSIQKTGSWAIRNMVSRSKQYCYMFHDLGVEELLRTDLKKFKDIEYDVKAALRDLGCKVQMKEEWSGKGKSLKRSNTDCVD